MKHTLSVPSPIGKLWLQEEDGALVRVSFQPDAASQTEEETPLLGQAKQQLAEYFAGQRQAFDLPLRMQGTPFQQKVWAALRAKLSSPGCWSAGTGAADWALVWPTWASGTACPCRRCSKRRPPRRTMRPSPGPPRK